MQPLILAIDDEEHMRGLLKRALSSQARVITAATGRDGLRLAEKEMPALVLLDMRLPDLGGLEVLKAIKGFSTSPVIMITAYGSIETAIEAMKAGAADYLTKPFDLEELRLTVARNLKMTDLAQQVEFLRGELEARYPEGIVGDSEPIRQLRRMVDQVADTAATVLLTGESGTGKEVVAREIHARSCRRERPLVVVNCAAVPEDLLSSELFGHEKGAFTGAHARKAGKFEIADGGTIFLDEIAEMSPQMQAKLLRVLQSRSFERVGGTDTLQVDVRVIAATNRDIERAMRDGSFREDLYYRLNVIRIHIPPLRERKSDIPLLAEHFLKKYDARRRIGGISVAAMEMMKAYSWPGNVRELENAIERAVIVAGEGDILPEHLPLKAAAGGSEEEWVISLPRGSLSLEAAERQLILEALRRAGGNRTLASRLLGITRSALLYRMDKHGIVPE